MEGRCDADFLPPLHEVNFADLDSATSEESFVREGFELLKESSVLLTAVAGLRGEAHAAGLHRDHAIVVGHYARMIKLMKSLIRQVSDGHGGDQQIAINREYLDSVSTVMYLLADSADGTRFTAYVMDSLIAEREILKEVREQIALRGDAVLPIEERINRSIAETLAAAGVREEEIPSRRSNGWPGAKVRIELLGPVAYTAYRAGSGAVHGTFADIYKNHLDETPGGFEIELRPQPFRPQPLLSMGLLGLLTLGEYSTKFLDTNLPEALASRGRALVALLRRVDEAHERFLTERGTSTRQ